MDYFVLPPEQSAAPTAEPAKTPPTIDELCGMDPDRPGEKTPKFDYDDEFCKTVLGSLICRPDSMGRWHDTISPKFFVDNSHELIYETAREYYRKFGKLADKKFLLNEVKEILSKKKHDNAAILQYQGELATVWNYFSDSPQEGIDLKLAQFAEAQATQTAILKVVAGLRGGGNKALAAEEVDELIVKMLENRQQIRMGAGKKSRGKTYFEMLEHHKEYEWIFENWFPRGTLKLLSGRSKGGKTTFFMGALADAIYDGEAFGEKAAAGPVIWLDFDANPVEHLSQTVAGVLGDRDPHVWNKYFSLRSYAYEDESGLPPCLTVEFLRQVVEQAEQDHGGAKGVVMVDCFISAFNRTPGQKDGWYFDADIVRRVLAPVVAYIRQCRWGIVFVHHTNQGGKTYGSIGIPAAVDTVDTFDRPKGETRATVFTEGRLPKGEITRKFDFRGGRYVFLGEGGDAQETKKAEGRQADLAQDLVQFMSCLPPVDAPITTKELAEKLNWTTYKVRRFFEAHLENDPAVRFADRGGSAGRVWYKSPVINPESTPGSPGVPLGLTGS